MIWLIALAFWLLFNIIFFVVLNTCRPTPRQELPDYLRRAL